MQLCKHTTSPALSIPSCESRFCNLRLSKPTSARGCVRQSTPTGHFPRSRSICRRPEAARCGWHSSAPPASRDQNGSLSQSFPAQQQARASASSSPSEPVGMFRGLGTSPYPLGLGSGWSWTYVGGFWVSVAGLEESRVAELASKPRFHADLLATLRSQDAGFERAKRPVEPWAWRGVGED
jgi:hypothetical protein